MRRQQAGIGQVLMVVTLVVVLAITGLIGYKLYSADPADQASGSTMTGNTDTTAPAIESSADLDKATTILNDVDDDATDQSDSAKLDAELDSF